MQFNDPLTNLFFHRWNSGSSNVARSKEIAKASLSLPIEFSKFPRSGGVETRAEPREKEREVNYLSANLSPIFPVARDRLFRTPRRARQLRRCMIYGCFVVSWMGEYATVPVIRCFHPLASRASCISKNWPTISQQQLLVHFFLFFSFCPRMNVAVSSGRRISQCKSTRHSVESTSHDARASNSREKTLVHRNWSIELADWRYGVLRYKLARNF